MKLLRFPTSLSVGGEIVELIPMLKLLRLINKDPYGKGWMVKIKISDKAECDNLLTAEKYKALL